jgi:hypothetical protein
MTTPTFHEAILDQAMPLVSDSIADARTLGDEVLWDLNAQIIAIPTPQGLALQAMYVLTVWMKNPLLGVPALAHVHQFTDPWQLFDDQARNAAAAGAVNGLRQQRLAVMSQQNGHTN